MRYINIADNILKYHLQNVYVITGHACGGKTTASRYLADKYDLMKAGRPRSVGSRRYFTLSQEILANRIAEFLKRTGRPMHIKEIAGQIPDKPETTIRGRLNTNLQRRFERVARGVYMLVGGNALVVQGDDLSIFDNDRIDAIVTDHPWEDERSNAGRNRRFDKSYNETSIRYTVDDL